MMALRLADLAAALALAFAFASAGALALGETPRDIRSWNRNFIVGATLAAALLFPLSLILGGWTLRAVLAGLFVVTVAQVARAARRGGLGEMARSMVRPFGAVRLEWPCRLLLAIVVLFAIDFTVVSLRETYAWDGFDIWATKAMVLMHHGRLTPELWPASASPHFNITRVVNYPPLVPLYEALLAHLRGGFDWNTLKPVFPVFYLSLLISLYQAGRALGGRVQALAGVLLVALLPMVSGRLSIGGYADMPLAAVLAAVLAAALEPGSWERGWRAPLAWTVAGLLTAKSEGLVLAGLAAGCAAVWARRARRAQVFQIGGVIAAAAGLRWAYVAWTGVKDPDFAFAAMLSSGTWLARIPEVAEACAARLLDVSAWGLFWPAFLAACAVVAFRGNRTERTIAAGGLAGLLVYSFIYLFTSYNPAFHINDSYDRLLVQIAPAAALAVLAGWRIAGRGVDRSLWSRLGNAGARVGAAWSRVGSAWSRVGSAWSRVGNAGSRVGNAGSRVGNAGSQVGSAGSRVGSAPEAVGSTPGIGGAPADSKPAGVAACLAVLAAVNLFVFRDHWRGASSFTFDFPMSYYAFTSYWITSLQMGEWPHWIPYQSMGYPAALNTQLGLFYPPFWIFVLLRLPYTLHAANIVQVLHVLWGSAGFFLFARRSFRLPVALCGAVCFGLFGGFYSNAQEPDIVRGFAWAPWLLWALLLEHAVVERSAGRWRFRTRIRTPNLFLPAVVFCFITGVYPGLMIAGLFIAGWFIVLQAGTLFAAGRGRAALRDGAIQCAQVGLGIGMALVYLLPASAMIGYLTRVHVAGNLTPWYLHLSDVYQLFLPSNLVMTGDYSMHAMQLPMMLLLFVPLARARAGLLVPVAGIAALAGVMCLDKLHAVSEFIARAAPVFRLSRFPAGDYRVFVYLPVLIGALAGLEHVLDSHNKPLRNAAAMLAALALLLILSVYLFTAPLPAGVAPTLSTYMAVEGLGCVLVIGAYLLFVRRQWPDGLWVGLLTVVCIAMAMTAAYEIKPFWNDPQIENYLYDRQGLPLWGVDHRLRVRGVFQRHEAQRPARTPEVPPAPGGYPLMWRGYIDGSYMTRDRGGTQLDGLPVVRQNPALTAIMLQPGGLIEVNCTPAACSGGEAKDVDLAGRPPAGRSLEYSRNRAVYEVDVPARSLLVENELYAPGWSGYCEIHGERFTPERVDSALRGWVLGPGNHRLRVTYRTPLLASGTALSALFWACWLATGIVWYRSRETIVVTPEPSWPARMRLQRAFEKLGRLGGAGYLGCALLVALLDILYILRHYTGYPFGDHWIWLAVLYERGLPATLYAQFNEHRLAVPGLLYCLDHRFFGSANRLLIAASMLIQAGCIALLTVPFLRQANVPRAVRYVFGGFVTIAMLWFIQAENFFYPFSLCLACSNLGILASLYLFSRFIEGRSGGARSSAAFMAGAMVFGVWATLSYGHGILVWPVLLAVGLTVHVPGRFLLIILLVFLCVVGFYFFHYRTPADHASPFDSLLHRPGQVVQYVIVMIGLPFFRSGAEDLGFTSRFGSYAITLGGILSGVVLLLRFAFVKPEERNSRETFYVSLVLLALGSAFITALGRSHFPIAQSLSGRYAPVPLFFWIGIIALATIHLCRWEARGVVAVRAIWAALLILASAATLPTQFFMGRYMASRERAQAAAAMSITVGVPDVPRVQEEMAGFPLVSFVDKRVAQTLGHSLFARPEATLLGTPLLTHFDLAPPGACLGRVDMVDSLASPSPRGARLVGWVWDIRQKRDAIRIWVADDQMIIQGIGITHVARPDVSAAYGNGRMASTGWIAYSRRPLQGPGALTAYADLGDGGSVCQVGAPGIPAP